MSWCGVASFPGIECRVCGHVSWNDGDVRHRYCGFCHVFHMERSMIDKPDFEGRLPDDVERTLLQKTLSMCADVISVMTNGAPFVVVCLDAAASKLQIVSNMDDVAAVKELLEEAREKIK